MSLLPAIDLSDSDKLDTLRRLDQFRTWRALDDKRYCLCCGNLLTGREIQVVGGTRGTGPLRVICPTERCNSIPMDWALPTDELLSKTVMRRNETLVRTASNVAQNRRPAAGSPLGWVTRHFKRSV